MHLNLFAHGCGHHSAAWRAPGSAVDRLGDVTWWEELARTAERGRFDAFFLADGQSLSPVPGPSWFLEPVTALTALARATTRIGLVSTISSTFWDPFHAARLSAGLDHISGGRAGINVVTSMTDAEARNHGMDRLPDHEERYARAAEYGRDPDNLVIMPGLVTFVGATEEEARAKQRELNELLPVADSLRQLSFFVGRDTSGWALDEPVLTFRRWRSSPVRRDATPRSCGFSRPPRTVVRPSVTCWVTSPPVAATRPSSALRSRSPTRWSGGSSMVRPTDSTSCHPPCPAGSMMWWTWSSRSCRSAACSAGSTRRARCEGI